MTPFHDTLGIGTDTRYEKSYQIKRAIKLLYRYDTNQHIKPQMSTVPSRDLSGALMPPATYHPNQITVQTRHIEIEPSAVYASIYLNSVYPAGAHNMPCLNPKAVSI